MRFPRLLAVALATGALAASTTTALAATASTSTAASGTSPQVLLGSYDGLYDADLGTASQWLPETQALHAWQGKNEAVTNLYAAGITSATSTALIPALTTVWNQAHTVPSVSWTVTYSNGGNEALANGADDSQLDAFAAQLKTWLAGPDGKYGTADDRRLYLRPDWEANGDWYGYSPDYGDPTSSATFAANAKNYVAMWQHLVTRLRGDGLDNSHVAFVWSVADTDSWRTATSGSGGEPIAADIWPGAQYVDWVGIDGYNMGSTTPQGWRTPAKVFFPMISEITGFAPGVPIALSEVGTLGVGAPAGQSESTWISSYFTWLAQAAATYPIRMSVWFNSPGNGGDFRVFGPTEGDESYTYNGVKYSGYSTYQQGVASSLLVGSDTTNARLLTDSQFLGQ